MLITATDKASPASFWTHYNIVLLTYLLTCKGCFNSALFRENVAVKNRNCFSYTEKGQNESVEHGSGFFCARCIRRGTCIAMMSVRLSVRLGRACIVISTY